MIPWWTREYQSQVVRAQVRPRPSPPPLPACLNVARARDRAFVIVWSTWKLCLRPTLTSSSIPSASISLCHVTQYPICLSSLLEEKILFKINQDSSCKKREADQIKFDRRCSREKRSDTVYIYLKFNREEKDVISIKERKRDCKGFDLVQTR